MDTQTLSAGLAQLQVKYVSLPPGAGKTTAAIEMMRQHLERKLSLPKIPKYVFYVAATQLLLMQTATNLRKTVKSRLRENIRIAYSEAGDPTTVQEQVQNILAGLSNSGSKKQPFPEGSILFMTHEAFLMLSQSHLEMYSETLVIFDEARKWADMVSPVVMDDGTQDFFDRLFTVRPMRSVNDAAGISEIIAKKIPENQKMKALEGCGKKAARAFRALDELHRSLNLRDDAPSRMRVYAFFEKMRGRTSRGDTVLIQVKLPSFPFIGFLDVFILSADFTTSQMYCFFKDEGTRVLNRSQWFMDTFHPDGYEKSVRRATKRYDKVDLVALTTDQTPPAIGKYQTGGLMIPRNKLVDLGKLINSWGLKGGDVLKVISRVRNPMKNSPSKRDYEIVDALTKMGAQTDTLSWLIKASHRVVRAWRKKNPSTEPALMFLNKDFQDRADVERGLFERLNHAKTVGDNSWSSSNAVVFLAAINPDPHMARLLKARLGHLGYDPKEDFIVDRVIQATGRGNIRTHGIKDRMLIVVPTEGLAQRVAERLEERPKYHIEITEKLGNYVSWNSNLLASLMLQATDPVKAERALKDRQYRDPNKRKKRVLTPEERKKERAIYRAAYRAKLDGDIELHDKLEAERDALRFIGK
jgi:hypothetical protein